MCQVLVYTLSDACQLLSSSFQFWTMMKYGVTKVTYRTAFFFFLFIFLSMKMQTLIFRSELMIGLKAHIAAAAAPFSRMLQPW